MSKRLLNIFKKYLLVIPGFLVIITLMFFFIRPSQPVLDLMVAEMGELTSGLSSNPSSTYNNRATPNTIGLSAGGAKDIENFRENIENGYLPQPTDVTCEGLFYDYSFDTGISRPCDELFCPSYSTAVTRDPLSGETEYYLSVGLNSGIKESDFERKMLNLVIVLDISSSMSSPFDQYYYGSSDTRRTAYRESGLDRRTKIECAKDAVVTILSHLNGDDWVSIVTFSDRADVFRDMGPIQPSELRRLENRVMDIRPDSSTNLDAGMALAEKQFRGLTHLDSDEYENRIIVLTDAQPNTGDISVRGLSRDVDKDADYHIYTTFIGIGVDFNSHLIELISKSRGCNYYSVHSPGEFRERMEEEFDFMVTPLVFDLELEFESEGWRIDRVYGSPEADSATGRMMYVNTLFPSKRENGETKGGLILLKLRRLSEEPDDRIYLYANYEDRNGHEESNRAVVRMDEYMPEYFGNSGIRKGILLLRYATLLQNWTYDERLYRGSEPDWEPGINERTGYRYPDYTGQWERKSLRLTVHEPYREILGDFTEYFNGEMERIGDSSLEQELDVLDTLLWW